MNDPILLYLAMIVIGIVGIWAPFRWSKSSNAQKALIILLVEWFVSAYVEFIIPYLQMRNLWLVTLSNLVEFNLSIAIFSYLKEKRHQKTILRITAVSFTVFWIIAKFTIEPISELGIYSASVSRLIEILVSVSIFFDLLKDGEAHMKDDFRIWFVSATLIYSTGSILLDAFFMEIIKIPLQIAESLWNINSVLNIITIMLFARALLCKNMQKQASFT
jgi:hypothetical protein